jgi:hypothetical protein
MLYEAGELQQSNNRIGSTGGGINDQQTTDGGSESTDYAD